MKAGKRMPALPDTGRQYVERTRGARLASPGIERFVSEKKSTPRAVVIGAVLAAALIAAMIWLSRAG